MKSSKWNLVVSFGSLALCGLLAFEHVDHVGSLGLNSPVVWAFKVALVLSTLLPAASFVCNCMKGRRVVAALQVVVAALLVVAYFVCAALALNFYYDSHGGSAREAGLRPQLSARAALDAVHDYERARRRDGGRFFFDPWSLTVVGDADDAHWRAEGFARCLLAPSKSAPREETNGVMQLDVLASGAVEEVSFRALRKNEPPSFLSLRSLLSYCKATDVPDEDIVALWLGGVAAGVIQLPGRRIRVAQADIIAAEVRRFKETIAKADRIVVRAGGYTCCCTNVDAQAKLCVITNAAEIAAFNKMFRFTTDNWGWCMCCGYPGVDWWRGDERLELTSVQHCMALRAGGFSVCDVPFEKDAAKELKDYFARRGIATD
ncbi:MAG: hypothetical protein IJ829_05765 [Kiritimatiellae bacterium]|nr:hypothetical protein [Kiritimatiellia bacterium]